MNPFLARDVPWLLRARAAAHPDKPFLVWAPFDGAGETWTWARFTGEVAALGGALQRRGVGQGDFVAIHLENSPEFLLAWFAIQSIGAIAVFTNTRWTVPELTHALALPPVVAVVTEPALAAVVDAALPPAARLVVTVPLTAWLEERAQPSPVALDPMDPAGLLFTSGTTGRSKGVVWTHANYLWAGKVGASHGDVRAEDRCLVYLPLFHAIAHSYSIMAAVWAGATIVLMPRFSTRRFWPTALAHRATWCSQIVFGTRALAAEPVPAGHRFRRWCNSLVGAPWDPHYGIPTIGWYGMTELVSTPIVSEPGSVPPSPAIGVPAPEYEVSVLDADGRPTRPGDVGRLEIRGRRGVSVALEYLHDPAATRAAWAPDGWFATGDRVLVTPEGWIAFADREKDVLKVGGENVAASEVEAVIARVPGVAEVAVVPAPHAMLDEVPVAFVVPQAADAANGLADRIIAACRADLADFKVPRAVYLLDALPRGTIEKVAKEELKRRAREAARA
ncbi:MAG: AMP-binding protein [Candidatus Rokubacteria bacterium]|nr:AMP-binding protein [Candidatus Rokubacteria bacterium]